MLPLAPSVLAYIDPGTGSILLQVLIASFLTAGVFFRRILFTPFAFLFGKRRRKEDDQQPSQVE